MGFVMYLLKDAITTGELPAPQANLMKLVIDGVIGGSLPWNLVFCGVFIAICVELLGINSLAFAVGLYLPLSLSVPIMAGGIIRWLLELKKNDPKLEEKRETGVLYSSGLIAGAALTGVLIMVLIGFAEARPGLLEGISKPGLHIVSNSVILQEINGQPAIGRYYKVSPAEFADTSDMVDQLSKGKAQLRTLKAAAAPDAQTISELETRLSLLSQELQKAKSKTLMAKFLVDGSPVSQELTLGKWDKLYLSADQGKIKASGATANHNAYGVVAFLLLCATLAYFAMRKPPENNK